MGHETAPPAVTAPSALVAEPSNLEPAGPPEPRATPEHQPEQPEQRGDHQQHPPRALHHGLANEEPAENPDLVSEPVLAVSAPPVLRLPPAPPRWLQLADRGQYQHAYQALEEHGGFDAVLLQASADELMILVDVARATGNRGRAIQALRRVTQSFVSDPNAPIAAMTLGRMLMQAGDHKGASEAFLLYRRLSPQGDFAEDALASDIQAAVEEGNLERAQALAKQYETDFPDGRHLEQIREQLSAAAQANGSDSQTETDSDGFKEADGAPSLVLPTESPY
jgi:predicted Zn-dependent protease